MHEAVLPMGKGIIEDRDKELSYWSIKERSPRLHSITLRQIVKRDEPLVSSVLLEPMPTEIAPSAGCTATAAGVG